MKDYDPDKPMFYMHVPRTGGNSAWVAISSRMSGVARTPRKRKPRGGFTARPGYIYRQHWSPNHAGNVKTWCKTADQFVTLLRNPVDRAISWWNYTHQQGHFVLGDHVVPKPDVTFKYWVENFQDEISKQCFHHLPDGEYPAYLDEFVFVGIVEKIQVCVDALLRKLGVEPTMVMRKNSAKRKFERTDEMAEMVRPLLKREIALYEHAVATWSPAWE